MSIRTLCNNGPMKTTKNNKTLFSFLFFIKFAVVGSFGKSEMTKILYEGLEKYIFFILKISNNLLQSLILLDVESRKSQVAIPILKKGFLRNKDMLNLNWKNRSLWLIRLFFIIILIIIFGISLFFHLTTSKIRKTGQILKISRDDVDT